MRFSKTLSLLILSGVIFYLPTKASPQKDQSSGLATLLDPDEAMELVLSSPLKFVGSFIPANSESGKIPSCLFRNAKVTVMYTYCRKNEAPALGMTIYSNVIERGHIRLYAEGDGRPVSELDRKEYERYMWKLIARPNVDGFRSDMTIKEYAEYYNKKEISYYRLGCHIWEQVGNENLTAGCVPPFEFQLENWLPVAMDFWQKPSANWYKVQNLLREVVEKALSR